MTEQPEHGSEKLSISFPAGTKAELRALVEAGATPSVSAFVADAVTERLRRGRFHEKIMALRDGELFERQAIEWACRTLGATAEETSALLAGFAKPGQEQVAS